MKRYCAKICAAFAVCLILSPAVTAYAATVDEILSAVIKIRAHIGPHARTLQTLGPKREGFGIVIDNGGLIVTIGYVILEADSVEIQVGNGAPAPAEVLAYDHESGLGLIRALSPPKVKPLRIGSSAKLQPNETVIVAGAGGWSNAIQAQVVSRRPFAGYWEYLLENAIFTQPPFPGFGGAALINKDGHLVGVGSLIVGDSAAPRTNSPGNMFIPIDQLKGNLADLIETGRRSGPRNPWLGVYTEDHRSRVIVTRLADDGPGRKSGVNINDIVVAIDGQNVQGQVDYYKRLWSRGAPGTKIELTLLRTTGVLEKISVIAGDRYDWLRLKPSN